MADDEHEAAAVQGYRHVVDAANPHLPFKIDLPHPFSGDGTEPFSAWIQRFEVAFNVSAVSLDKAKLLPVKLIGPAFAYWQSLPSEVKADYELTKASLTTVFGRTTFLATFQTFLNARPRKPQEPLEVYGAELTNLVTEAFPQYDAAARNCEIFRRFVTGLDPSLQLKIHEHGAVTLDNALKVATQCERAQLAISVANPSAVMPVMVNQQPSANTVTATHITELASAIAELRTDLHALRQSHLRRTDERVDQLSRRISSLQDEVTSSTQSPHQTCATVDYDIAARHRQPGLDDHHRHRDRCCTAQHTQRGRQHPRDDCCSPRHRHGCSEHDQPPPIDDFSCERHCSYSNFSRSRELYTPHPTQSDEYTPHRHHYGDSRSGRSPSREHRPDLDREHGTRYARSPSPSPQYRHSNYRRHSSPSPPPHPYSSQRYSTSPTRHVHFSQSNRGKSPFLSHQGNE